MNTYSCDILYRGGRTHTWIKATNITDAYDMARDWFFLAYDQPLYRIIVNFSE